nr:50S ribosomal protein L22P [uncultured archaeon]
MKNYVFRNFNEQSMARAIGNGLPISFKLSVEVCNFIRNDSVKQAISKLEKVAKEKLAVPFRRFDFDLGHKKKIGPGRYPVKVSKELIKLIRAAEANAQFKGLNTSNLAIAHISAHKAGKSYHYGRQSRTKMKKTNVEIVVEEKKAEKKGEKK